MLQRKLRTCCNRTLVTTPAARAYLRDAASPRDHATLAIHPTGAIDAIDQTD